MAKKKKKNKKMTSPTELTPAGEVKAKLREFNFKRAILLVLATVGAFAVYEALIAVPTLRIGGIPVIMPIYFIIVTVLTVAVIFLNHGFSSKPVTPDMLSGLGEKEELEAACVKINRQKLIAKRLMLVLIPFILSVFFDIIYLFYGDVFKTILSTLVGG